MSTTTENESGPTVRRTIWDVVLGILIIIAGFVLLGNVALTTALSVLVLGWITLLSGIVLLVGALFRIKSGGFWSAALGGAILVVLGLFILRNPLIGALSLTLIAGAMFLASGLTRLVSAGHFKEARWLMIISGVISIALGLWVLFNLGVATLTLLGTLVGIQILLEGITLIAVGRLRPPAKTTTEAKTT